LSASVTRCQHLSAFGGEQKIRINWGCLETPYFKIK
jgi:hypothetical protein